MTTPKTRRVWPATPLIVLAALTTTNVTASATPATLPEPDQAQIAELAQRYLANRAVKVTRGPQTPGFGVPVTPALAAKLRHHETRLEAARTSWSHLRTRYRSAEIESRIERFDVDQNGKTVVAHVLEHGKLYFERPGTALYTSYGLPHLLTVQRTETGWVLADVALKRYKHCGLLPETQSSTC